MGQESKEALGKVAEKRRGILRYVALMKLRIGAMIALTAVTAYAAVAEQVRPGSVIVLALAMMLGSSASAVVNHVCDRDIDRLMSRTRNRPMAIGTIAVANALGLAAVMIAIALALAVTAFNGLVALYLFMGAFIYAVVYTVWLKRRTYLNIVIGGSAGSFAVLAGAAVVQPGDWLFPMLLAAILFLWTPSHFWALSIMLVDDYRAANIPMLPVVIGEARTARYILANSLALVAASLSPWLCHYLTIRYAMVVACLGCVLLAFNAALLLWPTRKWAGWSFAISMPYLLGVFAAILTDRYW